MGVHYITKPDADALFTTIYTDEHYEAKRQYVLIYFPMPEDVVGMDWDVLREKFQNKFGISIDQVFQVFDKTHYPDYYKCYFDSDRAAQLVDKLIEEGVLPEAIDRSTIEYDIKDHSKGEV
jgi:hypothetical protein